MENAGLMVTAVSMLGGVLGFVISTFFVLMQMQSADKWNKKKTSEELLTQIMTGEFPKLMDKLAAGIQLGRPRPCSVCAESV